LCQRVVCHTNLDMSANLKQLKLREIKHGWI
jgi:hypothetical protein